MKYFRPSRLFYFCLILVFGIFYLSACQYASPVVHTPEESSPKAGQQTSTPVFQSPTGASKSPKEYPVRILPLDEPANTVQAELSGLTWTNETLLILPQYPERYQQASSPGSFGAIFAMVKSEILNVIDGKSNAPIQSKAIPIFAPDLKQKVPGYEGFESVVVSEGTVFFTIEAHQTNGMAAFLIRGDLSPDLSEIRLDTNHIQLISAQASISNFSDEAITLVNKQIFTFYEANGANILPTPSAHRFGLDGAVQGVIISPHLEYRITDATPADAGGRFWVINYFFPGDAKINPTRDPLFDLYGKPLTHSRSKIVERLVQMQWTDKEITLVTQPPVYLELLSDGSARNWEGIAQLDQRGFLLVTDRYPTTLLGFVAYP